MQGSGLCVFVAAYVSLFAIAGVLLFVPGISRSGAVHSELRWPYKGRDLLNCTSLQDVGQLEFVAGGWTKAVYRGHLQGQDVAVKTVNLNGHELQACQERGDAMQTCYSKAAAKLLREMILLTELAHDNIVKVLGSCVPEGRGPVVVITELGEPLDTVRLLQLTWEDRLQLALGVARILALLSRSPLGSLAMNDFRRQQFVLVDGVLKLSDVDDVGVDEPSCNHPHDCQRHLPDELKGTPSSCEAGRCHGHNERVNVWRAGRHFIRHLLPLGAPSTLAPHISELLEGYGEGAWDASKVLQATEQLVTTYAEGRHLAQSSQHLASFDVLEDQDLPGQFDYSCSESRSVVTCVRSVHGPAEAAKLCVTDPRCQAVVLSPHRTWTGRTLAVFKTGSILPSKALGHQLLVPRSPNSIQ